MLNENYSKPKQTKAVLGICAILIFFSHVRGYTIYSSGAGLIMNEILSFIGQLMVVMFFFYSGYGIFYSFEHKDGYESTFPKRRIFSTWLEFAVAVVLFALLNMILGIDSYSLKSYVLSFTGWTDIGNSNWFMFDLFVVYLLTYIGFLLVRHIANRKQQMWCLATYVFITTAIFVCILRLYKESWWYDTVLSYSFGGLFYLFEEKIFKVMKKPIIYWPTGIILAVLFYETRLHCNGLILTTLNVLIFTMLVIWITMLVNLANKVTLWLGKRSFFIYIYQRIPMIFLSYFGINNYSVPFVLLSFIMTILLAWGMFSLQSHINKKLKI